MCANLNLLTQSHGWEWLGLIFIINAFINAKALWSDGVCVCGCNNFWQMHTVHPDTAQANPSGARIYRTFDAEAIVTTDKNHSTLTFNVHGPVVIFTCYFFFSTRHSDSHFNLSPTDSGGGKKTEIVATISSDNKSIECLCVWHSECDDTKSPISADVQRAVWTTLNSQFYCSVREQIRIRELLPWIKHKKKLQQWQRDKTTIMKTKERRDAREGKNDKKKSFITFDEHV